MHLKAASCRRCLTPTLRLLLAAVMDLPACHCCQSQLPDWSHRLPFPRAADPEVLRVSAARAGGSHLVQVRAGRAAVAHRQLRAGLRVHRVHLDLRQQLRQQQLPVQQPRQGAPAVVPRVGPMPQEGVQGSVAAAAMSGTPMSAAPCDARSTFVLPRGSLRRLVCMLNGYDEWI